MTDSRPGWLDVIMRKGEDAKDNMLILEGETWEVEQNSSVSFSKEGNTDVCISEDDKIESEKIDDLYEKIACFLKGAQSKNELFSVERQYKDGKQLEFSVDKWMVGIVSLDLEAGFPEGVGPSEDGQQSVHIKPKIEDAEWFPMLALAEDWSEIDFSDTNRSADTMPGDFAGFIAYAYDSVLEDLFTDHGGLRQKHRTVERDLEAEIKGTVHISEYLTNITRGEVTTVPCSFSELTMDNQPNRVLLHALHGAQRLVRDHATSENTDINRRLLQHRRKFAAVVHKRIRPADIPQPDSLPPAFDGYDNSNALEVARFIIEELDLGIESGKFDSIELTAKMWELFEDAFAQVVADKLNVKRDDIAQDNWTYQIGENNQISPEEDEDDSEGKTAYRKKQMQPDIYLTPDEHEKVTGAIVADTKWKQIDPFFGDKKTVKNDDLFQITTYRDVAAQREDDSKAVGFLVYPCTDEHSNSVEPHPISLDGELGNVGDGGWGDIYVIGWQVGTTGDDTEFNLRESAENTVDKMIDSVS